MSYYYSSKLVFDQISRLQVGGIMAGLSSSIIKQIYVGLPSTNEQTAIAEILSDMDAEIAALEGKLSKARQVKQGMMSELLTGKITISGKLRVESGNPERHGCRSHRAGGETVQGAAGQAGHDVRAADGKGEAGVSVRREVV